MDRFQVEPDLRLLGRALPEGCGVVAYARAAAPPWSLRSLVGDVPGVLGIPRQTLDEVWADLVHPEDAARLRSAFAMIEPGDRQTLDYRVRTASGGERWVRDSFERADRGGEHLIVGVMLDVSLERTLRSQVARLEERIWRAQRVDSLGGLATGIAHDLGNLLTAILSAVQLIERSEEAPPSVLDELEVVRESARRGSDFVKQILRFAGREDSGLESVDVNAVVENLRLILARSLGTDVRLAVSTEPELPRVRCHTGQMEQVLLNLAVNAREAMPVGGQLTITTRSERLVAQLSTATTTLAAGDYVVISVSDTGRGIPAEVQPRIFEPFFSTKNRPGSGSGFGLSSVERILHAHQGGVRVESAEGRGTAFHIYLPVRLAPAGIPEIDGVPLGATEAPTPGRVLVVEADGSVRETIKRALARERFQVMAVETAADALRLFDRVRPPFEVVVCALVLPDRSGEELVRLLRKRSAELGVVYLPGGALSGPKDEASVVLLERAFTPASLIDAVLRARPFHGSRGALGA